ncbi:hypothetical protein F5887DRAFT_86112 [Amanita rubescens]|nr:hypothetical protein F5887DRAFT_86112 [Amanita rubescens]
MLNATYSYGFQVQLGLDTRRFIASGRCEANGVFEDLDTSDYHKYKIADIHSIESLPTEDQIDHDQLAEESLVKIDGKADIFTFRRYIGSYALATFRKEFETFSRYKHAHIRQIFGVCESKLTPGILFRGKLLRFLDYSTRDEACSVWSWISFVNGSKIVAPYFRRHLKSYLSDSVYPQKRYGVLIDYHDVYIDIGTDDHLSVVRIDFL